MEPGFEYYNEPRGVCLLCGISYTLDRLVILSKEQSDILERYFRATNSKMMPSMGYICRDVTDCDSQIMKQREQLR